MRAGNLLLIRAKAAISLITFSLLAATAAGSDIDFVLQQDGKRVAGAEVCLFSASPVPGDLRFLANSLRSNAVVCLPADEMIEVPVGRTLFFLTHPSGLISPVSLMSSSDPRVDAYKEVNIPARPAAIVDLKGLDGLLEPQTGVYFAVVAYSDMVNLYPQHPDRQEMLVPAGVPIVPLIVNRGVITRAGSPRVLATKERIAAESLLSPPGRRFAFVETMRPPQLFEQQASAFAGPLPPAPELTLRTNSGTLSPLVPPSDANHLYPGLFVFGDVALGSAEVLMRGPMWEPQAFDVTIGESITVAKDSLTPTPAGVLKVTWNVDKCAIPSPPPSITLRRCEGCDVTHRFEVTDRCVGQHEFESLSYGIYFVNVEWQGRKEEHELRIEPGKASVQALRFPDAQPADVHPLP